MAWIYEKLHDWTDDYPWDVEEALTWISIYQFSRAGPAAPQRIYYEAGHTSADGPDPSKICTYDTLKEYNDKVPIGFTQSPRDLCIVPSSWAKTLGPVVFEQRNEQGGYVIPLAFSQLGQELTVCRHFYAHEKPDLLVRDLKVMFSRDGETYKRISKKYK